MKIKIVPVAAGLVAAAGIAITGASLASADQTPSSTATTSNTRSGQGGATEGAADPSTPMRSDEQLLTGDTAAKVTAAAQAKEPTATIERVETDSDGVYEAHLVRTDGTHVIVQVDDSYVVTAVQEGGQGGRGAPGGAPGGAGAGESSTAQPSATT